MVVKVEKKVSLCWFLQDLFTLTDPVASSLQPLGRDVVAMLVRKQQCNMLLLVGFCLCELETVLHTPSSFYSRHFGFGVQVPDALCEPSKDITPVSVMIWSTKLFAFQIWPSLSSCLLSYCYPLGPPIPQPIWIISVSFVCALLPSLQGKINLWHFCVLSTHIPQGTEPNSNKSRHLGSIDCVPDPVLSVYRRSIILTSPHRE